METKLTQARLRELLDYDPATGEFRRRISGGGVCQGSTAGSVRPDGYIVIGVDYESHLAHRLVWLYVYGELPENDVDHINGSKADNRFANLRAASRSENLANCRMRKDNTSGLKGVSFNKRGGNWLAQISIRGRQTRIGTFPSKEEAYAAYRQRATCEFNDFARVPCPT